MHKKRVLILLVVLALGSLLIAGAANSALRTEGPSGDSQSGSSITYREDGGEFGGDDDRWGNAEPCDPDDVGDLADPGEPDDVGDDTSGLSAKQFVADGGLWSIRMRMILDCVFRIL